MMVLDEKEDLIVRREKEFQLGVPNRRPRAPRQTLHNFTCDLVAVVVESVEIFLDTFDIQPGEV